VGGEAPLYSHVSRRFIVRAIRSYPDRSLPNVKNIDYIHGMRASRRYIDSQVLPDARAPVAKALGKIRKTATITYRWFEQDESSA